MELIIRNNSGQPIYDQISGQIKAQILSGALSPGDALPSIRGLAKDLKISVITTKRAYEELEREGFLTTVPGKGCFVAPRDLELVREDCLRRVSSRSPRLEKGRTTRDLMTTVAGIHMGAVSRSARPAPTTAAPTA